MMTIGSPVPDWSSPAYLNDGEVVVTSKEQLGRWYVLYWYPLDFTFICPTEIRGFQTLIERFENINVSVIGASTDSFHSHKAWFADRGIFPDAVTHPVLADMSHAVSRLFDVLDDSQGVAFRATAIVDPEGVLRVFAVNDLNVGRSPAETLRTVQALQSGGLCGVDWQPGEAFAA